LFEDGFDDLIVDEAGRAEVERDRRLVLDPARKCPIQVALEAFELPEQPMALVLDFETDALMLAMLRAAPEATSDLYHEGNGDRNPVLCSRGFLVSVLLVDFDRD
jgi:hypothetical protein